MEDKENIEISHLKKILEILEQLEKSNDDYNLYCFDNDIKDNIALEIIKMIMNIRNKIVSKIDTINETKHFYYYNSFNINSENYV